MAATLASPTRVRPGLRGPGPDHGRLGLDGLRLTRRGRVVLIVLAFLVSLPLVGVGGRAIADKPSTPLEVTVHTVAPGDTLWGFARRIVEPGQDIRDVVARLSDLNELTSGALTVGQTIVLPKG
jgi:hypothetical protein